MDILVVDDDDTRLRWLDDTLTALGHDVRLAASGADALDQLREVAFDVIFCDHDLGAGDLTGSRLMGRVLGSRKYEQPTAVWVHSSNPIGAENIAAKVRSAGLPCRVEAYSAIRDNPGALQQALTVLVAGTSSRPNARRRPG